MEIGMTMRQNMCCYDWSPPNPYTDDENGAFIISVPIPTPLKLHDG